MQKVQQQSLTEERAMVPINPTVVETPSGLVMVWGFEHVSAKMLDMLKTVLSHDGFDMVYHGIKSVVFRIDGFPKENGKSICANFSPDVCGISINLEKTLEKAIERSMDHPETSILASWWVEMLLNFGHETHHGVRWDTDREKLYANDGLLIEDEEQRAEKYANSLLSELVKEYNLEMPPIEEEIWFNDQISELLNGKDDDQWAKSQKEMLIEKIVWRHEPKNSEPVIVHTFKEFICLITDGNMSSEEWSKPTIPNTTTLDTQINGETIVMNAAGEQVGVIQPPTAPAPAAQTTVAPVNNVAGNVFVDEIGECHWEEEGDDYDDQCFVQPATQPAAVNTQATNHPSFDKMPAAQEEQQLEMSIAEAGRIVQGIYLKMFNFVFKNCMPLKKADGTIIYPKDLINPEEGVWYNDPEAVLKTPLPLTAEEAAICVSMDYNDTNGRWCPNASTKDGLLGKVMKKAWIPAYQVTLRINGVIYKRLFLPQNPNKRNNTSGVLSGRAAELRAGDTLAYIKDSGTDAWIARIENGVYVPQSS